MKKLLSYDDLYNFYVNQNKNCTFSSKESDEQIFVQVPATFEIDEKKDDNLLLFCTVKIMHSGKNRNGSSVTDEALVKASKNLAYKPILANFVEYTDETTGEVLKDFTSHDMEIDGDSTKYIEKQVGCFTADEPYFEVEKETGHNFLYGRCAIPVEYTDAASIIKRKNGTKVSVELAVNELSFETDTKTLILSDVDIMGTTLLGRDRFTLDEVGEGMKNARLDIEDFNADNNSLFANFNQQMIDLQDRLEKLESTCFNNKEQTFVQKENFEKGGNTTVENKDVNFEEGVTETEEVTVTEENTEEVLTTETESEEATVKSAEGEAIVTKTESVEETPVLEEETIEVMTRSFEISHDDLRYALYNLLQPIESSDDTDYWISDVYDKYFIYESYGLSKIYKQAYTKDDDTDIVSFAGDRVELFRELLTANEKAELETMRKNYAALKEFKETTEKNELHEKREEILSDEKYSVISEKDDDGNYKNAAFAKLASEMDNYSLADLETQVKVIHSDYIAENSKFSTKEPEKKIVTKQFCNPSAKKTKTSRYGGLFADIDK